MTVSSDRERRLWLWTGAAVFGIYSTIGVATAISDGLRDRNLLRATLALAVLVGLGPVVWRWAKSRPDWREIGALSGVASVYWMVWVRTTGWEERTHLLEYGVVATLIHMALLERRNNGHAVTAPAAIALVATTSLGLVDEIIQAFVPDRVFDPRDVFFNFVAAGMAIAARLAVAAQNGPGWRVWFLWLWATAFGWGQGVYVGWYTPDDPKLLEAVPDSLTAAYLGVVTGGMLVATLQWLVLRRHLAGALLWIAANIAALATVGFVIVGVGAFDRDQGWLIGISIFGTAAGVLQWTLLRRQVPRAGWWIVASTAGWVAGMPFGDLNGPPGLGAIYGAATATALVWILRRRQVVATSSGTPSCCGG